LSADRSSPRLLVSVRNLEEARMARVAGSDLIDLKEPHRGSLGMVDESIAAQVAAEMPQSPLSLALGELTEWNGAADIPRIPSAIRFLKLGLSHQAPHAWQPAWKELRDAVDSRADKQFNWIAVIYADSEAARSPAPEEIIEAAGSTDCAGVLFDTWCKAAGSLTEHLPIDRLASYIESIHSAGMLTAVAGSVREEHLSELLPLGADIIAVRGAVCRGVDRTGTVCGNLIRNFRTRLNSESLESCN